MIELRFTPNNDNIVTCFVSLCHVFCAGIVHVCDTMTEMTNTYTYCV